MNRFTSGALSCVITTFFLSACGGDAADPMPTDRQASISVPDATFIADPPSGAVEVSAAITSAKAGDDIVVRAVVGGRKKVFVDGRAILIAADAALEHCPDEEGCPTPWDYCCETAETLRANTLTVQVVDADGKPLATTLRGVHGLEELVPIVVAGSVRSNDGSLIVDAKQIHVGR